MVSTVDYEGQSVVSQSDQIQWTNVHDEYIAFKALETCSCAWFAAAKEPDNQIGWSALLCTVYNSM